MYHVHSDDGEVLSKLEEVLCRGKESKMAEKLLSIVQRAYKCETKA